MKKILGILILIFYIAVVSHYGSFDFAEKNSWQTQASPGKLSSAHETLSANCATCHTATIGVDNAKCITCHGDNEALLDRQPTAFHGVIGNCSSCHIEHQGIDANLRVMDHNALAVIGEKLIGNGKKSFQLDESIIPADHPLVSDQIAKLNCATCHGTKDKHLGLMGDNCASCHAATQWTIPEFQHPSVLSINCSQCHQAPPSHYMMHFEMVSKKIAARSNEGGNGCCEAVLVSQCYSCHKTTSWNDIQGVGFYKHH
ncbi:MAG: hypothetical protein BGO21_25590 [Dyadobacter sp. 50-39]|uniref:cytochrome c3 family protein n=1 Tax=Dyadobacter sp. 50-39 TaxID=1895756 RepID=UPI000964C232|nr:cytochrome c3 family protein [Dyadobacter sp. 50-39]OJV17270.1 MAG: hypothetical protein BGO21_25590 [Dyadobacter sp. 50-39]